jgi:hypothetical protein
MNSKRNTMTAWNAPSGLLAHGAYTLFLRLWHIGAGTLWNNSLSQKQTENYASYTPQWINRSDILRVLR